MTKEQLVIEVNAEMLAGMRRAWKELIRRYNSEASDGMIKKMFADLAARYSEKGRFYHRLPHIGDMLELIDKHADSLSDAHSVRLAAWFHDAIYNPASQTNEEDSKRYAEEVLGELGIPSDVVNKVGHYIDVSKFHAVCGGEEDDGDLAFFIDCDLSILGSFPERYDLYTRQIRREYSHMSPEEGRVRRGEFLAGMLRRDRIFVSSQLANLEAPARGNMERELRSLEPVSKP